MDFAHLQRLKAFFDEELVKLYVFDGELARKLLNPEETHAESAIDSFYQITRIHEIQDRVESFWENYKAKARASEPKGLSQRQNRVDKLRAQLSSLRAERKTNTELKTILVKENAKLEKSCEVLRNRDRSLSEEYNKTRAATETAQHKVGSAIKDTLFHSRSPDSLSEKFSTDLLQFKEALDRLKLPSSTSAEFFKELAEGTHCVCDREIDKNAKTSILKNSKTYLDQNQWGVINEIKNPNWQFLYALRS